MNKKKIVSAITAPLLLVGLLVTGIVQADDNPAPSYGPGMMGGGYGYGPGMMGGGYGGYGPGMMRGWDDNGGGRGYGYGPGMMGGGYGYGPGMMGGGYGPGMMGGYGMMSVWSLDLTDKQRNAIDSIMMAQHSAKWPLMSRMLEAYGKLDKLYSADKWDAKAIARAYDEIFKIQREMIVSSVDVHNRIMAQLTDKQKSQLKRNRWPGRWHR